MEELYSDAPLEAGTPDTTPDGLTEAREGEDLLEDAFERLEEDTTPNPADEATNEAEPEPKPETLTLKINHREIAVDKSALEATAAALGVPLEQVVPILQKGMNYDRAVERELAKLPELKLLDDYAQLNGMTRQEYVRMLQSQRDGALLGRELETLRRQYPDAPEELLGQLAKQGLETRRQEQARQREQEARLQREQARQPWAEFFGRYPEIKAGEIPDEVYERVERGMNPTAAWLDHQNRQLQRELAAARQNEKNKKLTIGSARDQGEPVGGDPFLEGFDSVFR